MRVRLVSGPSPEGALKNFLPELRRNGEIREPRAQAMAHNDLFADVTNVMPLASLSAVPLILDGTIAAVSVADDLVVTFRRDRAQPVMIQSFIAGLFNASEPLGHSSASIEPVVIDLDIDLTVWTVQPAGIADAAARLWAQVSRDGRPEALDGLTTPSIYGNKLRIAKSLYAIAAATLPAGSPVLDVMSGTGIVTRILARRHPMTANDANPYAALLTRVQAVAFGDKGGQVASILLEELRETWTEHASELRNRYRVALETEAQFLHGELDEASVERYAEFVSDDLTAMAEGGGGVAGNLVTARYANAYFGVSQAIEIDAIRVAIERLVAVEDQRRDLCLAALVVAACTCNSGPHFAQPRKVNSQQMLRHVVERRARNVGWEFEVALRRLASREPLHWPIGPTSQNDWRLALDDFDRATSTRNVRTVYLDPPYSKLQYSRYYHVLNVILANDYPSISGTGRYPPRSYRFSSRFEYQPAMAKREFEEIIDRCADRGIGMMISYGERGFVSIEALIELVSTTFAKVDIFSETLRHHSQGRPMSGRGGGRVKEYVLVARP